MALGHKLTDRIEDGDRGLDWYLLRSATRQEGRAEASLLERGFPVYVPRMTRTEVLGRRRQRAIVHRPLFDGHLFSALDGRTQTLKAFNVEGVSGVVRYGLERVRPVPVHMIEAMVRSEVTGLFDRTQEGQAIPLEPGEEVRLLEGPFAGFPAWVVKLTKKQRVALLVSIFGRTSSVTVKVDQVERVA